MNNNEYQVCPVCQGRGVVPIGFYNLIPIGSSCSPELCRTCKGTGIIQKPEDDICLLKRALELSTNDRRVCPIEEDFCEPDCPDWCECSGDCDCAASDRKITLSECWQKLFIKQAETALEEK